VMYPQFGKEQLQILRLRLPRNRGKLRSGRQHS
jgi:hypothetical protein